MEALILDSKYDVVDVVDTFESFIWTDRFLGYGDFELYTPVESKYFPNLKENLYLMLKGSERLMILEDLNIATDFENGDRITVTGRSLESILDRRIIWKQTILSGSFQDAIQKLLNENIISPAQESRKIPNFTFKVSDDPYILGLTIDAQYYGENLYNSIIELCEARKVGFRILPKGAGGFEFELYNGEDRSFSQDENLWVEFSPRFDNLLSSNYLKSSKLKKTAALAAGEGEGADRKTIEVLDDSGGGSGLTRKELFVEASITTATEDGSTISETEYNKQLKEKGKTALAETKVTETFEGEIDTTNQYVYSRDFFIGDIVQIVNEYGKESRVRITEIVQSQDASGTKITPTFISMDEEEATE